jgi:MYXO-CTERM domain-containing protein
MGDAQDTFGAGGPLLDIQAFDVSYDTSNLHFSITFHTLIAPASSGLAHGLHGFLEFDIDENSATGSAPMQNIFSPPFAMLDAGFEFTLDLAFEEITPGFARLWTFDGMVVADVPLIYEAMAVHGTIALSDLGGDDGAMAFTAIFGTLPQPTDAIDAIGSSYAVPGPGALAMLALGGVCGRRRRRSRE